LIVTAAAFACVAAGCQKATTTSQPKPDAPAAVSSATANSAAAEPANQGAPSPKATLIKGFSLGMSAQAAKDAAKANGWEYWDVNYGGSKNRALIGLGGPDCAKSAVDEEAMFDQGSCQLRGFLGFDPAGNVDSMTFSESAFGVDVPVEAFVQAVANNYDVPELSTVIEGDGTCPTYQGESRVGETVRVRHCAWGTVVHYKAGTGSGSFN
jgi:hypothetical protein